MSEDFRPGDKIRITHEITVDRMGETCDQAAYAREGGLYMWNRLHSTVELIERADDPSKDPVGTVRQGLCDVWVKVNTNKWVVVGESSSGRAYEDDDTSAREVIGAVPGSPAAEKQAADELSRQTGA